MPACHVGSGKYSTCFRTVHDRRLNCRLNLSPSFRRHQNELGEAVAGLLSRGWVDSQDAVISLTETGEAQFGLVTAKVAELRQDLAAGISPEEYRATIDVLVRMVSNLESHAGSG